MNATRYLMPLSSRVDWCEPNYVVTQSIAEFFNTISNAAFIVLPPVIWPLYRSYTLHVDNSVHVALVMLFVIGASSVYFHATLSLVGQLLDEVSIVWLMLLAGAMWIPSTFIAKFPLAGRNRRSFQRGVVLAACVVTVLGFAHPQMNSVALVLFGMPLFTYIGYVGTLSDASCHHHAMRTIAIGGLAVACWLMDRLLCRYLLQLSFPYMHCIWHVIVFFATYESIVVNAYFYATEEHPALRPRIATARRFGCLHLPYVEVVCDRDGAMRQV